MTKLNAFEWAAKLTETIAALPDDAKIHGFETKLNIDSKPYSEILLIHLSDPLKNAVAVNGKQYSGWIEKRVWMKPDVCLWWAEEKNNDSNS